MTGHTGLTPRTNLVEELMYGSPDRKTALELVQQFEDSLTPGEGKPSRFSATPEDIHRWLVKNFCEDRVAAYQRAVGILAVHEFANDFDLEKADVRYPSSLAHIGRIECDLEHHNHTGRPDDVRQVTCRIQIPA